ncbi:MAG: response regulator [Deltaproteobacteria bacterium]|nr:response regulator [Deltaproteobacteria bacterium]
MMLEDSIEMKIPKPKHHILFVDDEEPLGELLVEFFTEKNFTSAYVLNADDAIKYLEKNRVDVVVSNINMPGMNGIEMTEIIRNKYSTRVIIFTGYSSPENRKKAYQKGAHAYLAKPAPIEQLYELVMKLLQEKVVYIGP